MILEMLTEDYKNLQNKLDILFAYKVKGPIHFDFGDILTFHPEKHTKIEITHIDHNGQVIVVDDYGNKDAVSFSDLDIDSKFMIIQSLNLKDSKILQS